jgi:D-amino-acid dehydrogenase
LFKYWWHSAPSRYRPIAEAYARLIVTCIDEHVALTRGTEAEALLRPIGWMRLYNKQPALNAAIAEAEMLKREQGVNYALLDEAGIAAAEPHLLVKRHSLDRSAFRERPAGAHTVLCAAFHRSGR